MPMRSGVYKEPRGVSNRRGTGLLVCQVPRSNTRSMQRCVPCGESPSRHVTPPVVNVHSGGTEHQTSRFAPSSETLAGLVGPGASGRRLSLEAIRMASIIRP